MKDTGIDDMEIEEPVPLAMILGPALATPHLPKEIFEGIGKGFLQIQPKVVSIALLKKDFFEMIKVVIKNPHTLVLRTVYSLYFGTECSPPKSVHWLNKMPCGCNWCLSTLWSKLSFMDIMLISVVAYMLLSYLWS